MFFSSNLKFLRKRKRLSQQYLAESLGMARSTLQSYEGGVQPPFPTLIKIADYFKFSIDGLVKYDLSKLSEFDLSQLDSGFEIDITGEKLRVLTITVDNNGKENIEAVPIKAQAGYTTGYSDQEYISSLPKFQLPFLSSNKTYRCFEIEGDSMLPVKEGDWVTASYIDNWSEIKDGRACIVVTKDDGIVFKLVYRQSEDMDSLLLVSTNSNYRPFQNSLESITEIWKFERYIGLNPFKENGRR